MYFKIKNKILLRCRYRWAFVGSYDMDNVNDKDLSDEPPRPPDFVPHVTRIAHLMDHKVSKKQNKKNNFWKLE